MPDSKKSAHELMGMSKMTGESETQGTLFFAWFLALAWAPSGIAGQYVSSLPAKRPQVSKNNNPWHESVLNVFPTTTSEPQT